MESLAGLIIENKYQFIEKIGKGGMGAVYLAKDLKLNTYWAVKVIKKTQDGVDLLAEPNMLKMLQHPMLPRITDISESSLYFFIVMDFIDGRTLESIAKERGRIREELVINWSKQICNALDYLHNLKPNPIIYRDMKPENVMLTKEGNIKIIDFGIAREFKFDASEDTNYLGTRGYAAPEQYRINNSQTDTRTDIYGLGVTMYRLLTNKTPDEPPYEIKPVREFDSKLSEGIEHIVIKSTALDPNLRYNNVREVLHDLDNVKTIGAKFRRKSRIRRVKIALTIMTMVFSIGMIASGLESYKSYFFENYKKRIDEGIKKREKQEFEAAILSFKEAENFNKGELDLYESNYEIVKTYAQSWELDAGIEYLEILIQDNEELRNNTNINYWQGKLNFLKGDYISANKYFESVNAKEVLEKDFEGIDNLSKVLGSEKKSDEEKFDELGKFIGFIDKSVLNDLEAMNLYIKVLKGYSELLDKTNNQKLKGDIIKHKFEILDKLDKTIADNFIVIEQRAIAYREKAVINEGVNILIVDGTRAKKKEEYLKESLEEYKKCLDIKENSNIYLGMAEVYLELKDKKMARFYIEKATSVDGFKENDLYQEIKDKVE